MLPNHIMSLFAVILATIAYFNEMIYNNVILSIYQEMYLYLINIFCIMFGYCLNIYFSSYKWKMVPIEDMYMIELNDFYGSKVIFVQKNIRLNKTIKFNYNLKEYTLMKRVNIQISDNVKKVLDFIKED